MICIIKVDAPNIVQLQAVSCINMCHWHPMRTEWGGIRSKSCRAPVVSTLHGTHTMCVNCALCCRTASRNLHLFAIIVLEHNLLLYHYAATVKSCIDIAVAFEHMKQVLGCDISWQRDQIPADCGFV